MWGSGGGGANDSHLVYFLSTFALLATALLLAFTRRGIRAASSRRMLLLAAFLASCAAVVLGFVRPDASPVVRGLMSVATGVGSGFLLVRTAFMLEDMNPREALRTLLMNSLLLLVLHLVLESLPGGAASVARSCCFIAAALLYSLAGRSPEDAQALRPHDFRQLASMWRLFLTMGMVILVLTLEVSCFYGPTVQADAAITIGALVVTSALFLCACYVGFNVDFARLFHPVVIALVVAFSLGMILGSASVWSTVLTGVSRFVWQTQFYAVCVFVAYRVDIPNAMLLVAAHAATCLGDMLGRGLSLVTPHLDVYTPQGAATLVLFVVAFLVVLTLVFPRERLVRMCELEGPADTAGSDAFAADTPSPEKDGATPAGPSNWRRRCFAIADRHGLTARERDVLIPLTHGLSCERISDELGLSYYTVRAHTRNIYTKTGVHSKQELIDLVESAAE